MTGNGTPAGFGKWTYDTAIGSHSFTFRDFSRAKGMGPGKRLSSDTLSVGGYDWALYLYPDGKEQGNSTYVSAYIALATEGKKNVMALFELTLLDQSGRDRHKVRSHFKNPPENGPRIIKPKGMWGYHKYFRTSVLEQSSYIKDDCISMNFTVGVIRLRLEGAEQDRIPIPPPTLVLDLKILLETGMASDLCIIVGGKEFKAHKSILAVRSPVFRNHFLGQNGDPNVSAIEILDTEPSIFKAVLHFIYTDSCQISGSASTDTVKHLWEAAHRYGLDRLKRTCEARIFEEVDAQNTVAAATVSVSPAEQHQYSEQLKSICSKFAAAGLLQQR